MSELEDQLVRLERVAAEQLHGITGDPMEALRTLPEVVEAAADIWKVLPGARDADSDRMESLVHAARTIGQILQANNNYDPARARDAGLLPVAEALTETETLSPAHTDPDSARRQVMHIVHLSAHAARVRVAGDLAAAPLPGQDRDLLRRGLAESTVIDELAGSHQRQLSNPHSGDRKILIWVQRWLGGTSRLDEQ